MTEFADIRESDRFNLRRLYNLVGSDGLENLVKAIEPMSPGWHPLDVEICRICPTPVPPPTKKLPEPFRSRGVAMLSRVGGAAWAEMEVDTPAFVEDMERRMARIFNGS